MYDTESASAVHKFSQAQKRRLQLILTLTLTLTRTFHEPNLIPIEADPNYLDRLN